MLFGYIYMGAIFTSHPLSILTFYFVLLKKVAKILFVSNFTEDGKYIPTETFSSITPGA